MIAIDTNIIVHAHREKAREHVRAKKRLVALAEGEEEWAIPVFCLGEFLRLTTHAKILDPPFTPEEATLALERVLESPSLKILYPSERYAALLLEVIRDANISGNLVFDAQIAALCREHGVKTLLTEDGDFARFKWLKTERL